jgi:hypothetical protein
MGPIDQDIGSLKNRIPQEAIGGEIPVSELLLLLLIGRVTFQPGKRNHHGEEEVEHCMLLYMGLEKKGRLVGVQPDTQPID